MAHLVKVHSSWSGVTDLLPVDLEALDANLFVAVNGDDGGTWAPSAVITIGGSGLTVTGPTLVTLSSSLTAPIVYANNDFAGLAPGHVASTRSLMQNLSDGSSLPWPEPPTSLWTVLASGASSSALPPLIVQNATFDAPQFLATDIVDQQLGVNYTPSLLKPLRVCNGSMLSQVTFNFAVGYPHSNPPANPPKFRVFRRTLTGALQPLKSRASGADGDGFASPALPTTGAAWYAGGAAQSFVYSCDQNNAIDISQYTYWAQIVEESGNTAWPFAMTRLADVAAIWSTQSNSFIDGPSTNGERTLILSSPPNSFPNAAQVPTIGAILPAATNAGALANSLGTYNSSGPTFSPLPDFTGAARVLVRSFANPSTAAPGAYFELLNRAPANLSTDVLRWASNSLNFPPGLTAYGNIYTSATPLFTGITDLRWQ